MNHVMKNYDFAYAKTKAQISCAVCFHYMDRIIPLLCKPLAIFCCCQAGFVLDLVGNPED